MFISELLSKMIIKIPFKTPTINHLYWHRGNMKIMKTEAKELRAEIKEIVYQSLPFIVPNLNDGLRVEVEVYEKWMSKKQTVIKKDILNREKFLIDSVFEGLGVDDKYIFEYTMKKINSEIEHAIVKITPIQ